MLLLCALLLGMVVGMAVVFSFLGLWSELGSDLVFGWHYLIGYCARLFPPQEPPQLTPEAKARVKRELIARLEANRRRELDAVTRDYHTLMQGERRVH